jgi:ABC-type antimicrobial peptide transport system permease subunit
MNAFYEVSGLHGFEVNMKNIFYSGFISFIILLIGVLLSVFPKFVFGFGDVKMISVSYFWMSLRNDIDNPSFLLIFILLICIFGLMMSARIGKRFKKHSVTENFERRFFYFATPIPLAPAIFLARILLI